MDEPDDLAQGRVIEGTEPADGVVVEVVDVCTQDVDDQDVREPGNHGLTTGAWVVNLGGDEIDAARAVMEAAAEPAVKIDVPLVVDAGQGRNWAEAH